MLIARILLLLTATLFIVSPVSAYLILNEEEGTDILIMGLATYYQNFSTVEGDRDLFEFSDEGLPERFSNNSFVSIYGEGIYKKLYELEFMFHYDEENTFATDEPLTFYMRLQKEESFISIGDHTDGFYRDTVFTGSTNEFRGGMVHLEKGKLAVTAVAAGITGEAVQEEIRGDGTSGPYVLEFGPVFEYSETIVLQLRDKNNFSSILSSKTLARGIDYVIDYDDSEIYFDYPVEEQDFSGNPYVLVVSYQYKGEDETYTRGVAGLRGVLKVTDHVAIGATYLAEGSIENNMRNFWDDRRQIAGVDITVDIPERFFFNVEQAFSGPQDSLDEGLGSRALMDWNITDRWNLQGEYWRVDRDFETFADTDLSGGNVTQEIDIINPFFIDSYDGELTLDPDIEVALGAGEESYGLATSYILGTYNTVSAGVRLTHDNIPEVDEEVQESNRFFYVSIKEQHPTLPNLFFSAEYFMNQDDLFVKEMDNQSNRFTLAAKDFFGPFPLVGDLGYQIVYQYEQYDEQLTENDDTTVHDLLVRLSSFPRQEFEIYFEQQESLLYEDIMHDYTNRIDTSIIGFDGTFNDRISGDASIRYSQEVDLLNERTAVEEIGYRLLIDWQALKNVRTQLKFELVDTTEKEVDPEESTINLRWGGLLDWRVFKWLKIILRYTQEDDRFENGINEKDISEKIEAQIQYNWKKLEVFAKYKVETEEFEEEIIDTLKTITYTTLFGLKYQVTKRWSVLGGYKDVRITEDLEDERTKYYAELEYEINKFFSVGLGYEHVQAEGDLDEEEAEDADETGTYKADTVYVRGTVKF